MASRKKKADPPTRKKSGPVAMSAEDVRSVKITAVILPRHARALESRRKKETRSDYLYRLILADLGEEWPF